ncbi:hypothetical protein CFP56_022338 [Quercus suber]|uniref:Uncharacterized protein n=1 Tax=Quercus suber TaxID=58331 RepID=A0AAW0KCQ8_QUESU
MNVFVIRLKDGCTVLKYGNLIAPKRIPQVTNSDHFSQSSLPSAHKLSIAHDHTLSLPLKHHNYRSKHDALTET